MNLSPTRSGSTEFLLTLNNTYTSKLLISCNYKLSKLIFHIYIYMQKVRVLTSYNNKGTISGNEMFYYRRRNLLSIRKKKTVHI